MRKFFNELIKIELSRFAFFIKYWYVWLIFFVSLFVLMIILDKIFNK
jgi:hypothetical protein